MNAASFSKAQAVATTSQAVVADEPYNLGKALFSGNYKFGKPKLTAANVGREIAAPRHFAKGATRTRAEESETGRAFETAHRSRDERA